MNGTHVNDRVTPERVKAAREKCGLRLVRGTYLSADGRCGCPLTVVLAGEGDIHAASDQFNAAHAARRRWGTDYREGFTLGYDKPGSLPYATGHAFLDGLGDGQECASVLQEAIQ